MKGLKHSLKREYNKRMDFSKTFSHYFKGPLCRTSQPFLVLTCKWCPGTASCRARDTISYLGLKGNTKNIHTPMQARSQTRETKGAYPLSRAGVLFEISTSACFAMQKATFQMNIRVSLFFLKRMVFVSLVSLSFPAQKSWTTTLCNSY